MHVQKNHLQTQLTLNPAMRSHNLPVWNLYSNESCTDRVGPSTWHCAEAPDCGQKDAGKVESQETSSVGQFNGKPLDEPLHLTLSQLNPWPKKGGQMWPVTGLDMENSRESMASSTNRFLYVKKKTIFLNSKQYKPQTAEAAAFARHQHSCHQMPAKVPILSYPTPQPTTTHPMTKSCSSEWLTLCHRPQQVEQSFNRIAPSPFFCSFNKHGVA